MTISDERKILNFITQSAQRLLASEEGVKKREACYQMLVGLLVLMPISVNQAIHFEKAKDELDRLRKEVESLKEELSQVKRGG
jgi:hypothetical protein